MPATIDAPTLEFTAHCQVRYLERFVDKEAVRAARRLAKSDAEVLELLAPDFGDDLRHFRHVAQVAYFHTLHKAGKFVEGTPYRINVGTLTLCVEGNVCKTTVCKHYEGLHPEPPDDDPMEEPLAVGYEEELVA